MRCLTIGFQTFVIIFETLDHVAHIYAHELTSIEDNESISHVLKVGLCISWIIVTIWYWSISSKIMTTRLLKRATRISSRSTMVSPLIIHLAQQFVHCTLDLVYCSCPFHGKLHMEELHFLIAIEKPTHMAMKY